MGFLGRIGKTGKALIRAGLTAGAFGAWLLAPRCQALRKLQGASSLLGAYFAHRGLHDSGSGIEADRAKAGADELEYVELAQVIAGSAVSASSASDEEAASPDSVQACSLAPENSMAAFAAAAQMGYGIELDVHLSRDGQVVVIHDDDLRRVAGDSRKVADLTYEELQQIALTTLPTAETDAEAAPSKHGKHARQEDQPEPMHVPLLSDVLKLVEGRVPIIVEYKMGPKLDRRLMEKTDALLTAYNGPYAIESFNPLAVAWYRRYRPSVCRGQLAAPYHGSIETGSDLVQAMASSLMFNWLGRPDFVAYEWHGGLSFPMRAYRALGGLPVAWTLRSREAEREAAGQFDYFIFEGYLPPVAY